MPTKKTDQPSEPAAEFTPIEAPTAPVDAPADPPAPPPAPSPAEVRTAEQWAEAKGMLPEFIEAHAPFAAAGSPPLRAHNPQSWRFAATKAGSGWPIGKELTEAEFDAAVIFATTGHQYR